MVPDIVRALYALQPNRANPMWFDDEIESSRRCINRVYDALDLSFDQDAAANPGDDEADSTDAEPVMCAYDRKIMEDNGVPLSQGAVAGGLNEEVEEFLRRRPSARDMRTFVGPEDLSRWWLNNRDVLPRLYSLYRAVSVMQLSTAAAER